MIMMIKNCLTFTKNFQAILKLFNKICLIEKLKLKFNKDIKNYQITSRDICGAKKKIKFFLNFINNMEIIGKI